MSRSAREAAAANRVRGRRPLTRVSFAAAAELMPARRGASVAVPPLAGADPLGAARETIAAVQDAARRSSSRSSSYSTSCPCMSTLSLWLVTRANPFTT